MVHIFRSKVLYRLSTQGLIVIGFLKLGFDGGVFVLDTSLNLGFMLDWACIFGSVQIIKFVKPWFVRS